MSLKICDLAKEVNLPNDGVMKLINTEFGTNYKHYKNIITKQQWDFVKVFRTEYSDKIWDNSWKNMPWDAVLRDKTKGHDVWRRLQPLAWEAFLRYEANLITENNKKYIETMRNKWL